MDQYTLLTNKVETWLGSPLSNSVEEAIESSNELIQQLQTALQSSPENKKTLGPMLGKVKAMQKALDSLEMANWQPVLDGYLCIGHRPSAQLISDLRLQNATHVLTLLSSGEGAKDIEILTKKSGLQWLWFPMQGAHPVEEERNEALKQFFLNMKNALANQAKIYLHCSAGIHRTGMITYAFLRFIGFNPEKAKTKLKELRVDTFEGVGQERTDWAEGFIASIEM